ncbi:hypothetical protein Avbf_00744, partial [Armadillidium vulgare]
MANCRTSRKFTKILSSYRFETRLRICCLNKEGQFPDFHFRKQVTLKRNFYRVPDCSSIFIRASILRICCSLYELISTLSTLVLKFELQYGI